VPRVFFAVWPDAPTAERLHTLGIEAGRNCSGRVMRRDTLHVTLAFLGEQPTDRLADARRAADAVAAEPFDLKLDRLGYWKHNRILWAGGVSPRLTFLAGSLADQLRTAGFSLEERPFVAHLTLLRDARCAEVPVLPEPFSWPVREFVLAESRLAREGSRYEIIGRWPLA
jgi:RNA 2',3'-cyclic 3'-phosphodiesterase